MPSFSNLRRGSIRDADLCTSTVTPAPELIKEILTIDEATVTNLVHGSFKLELLGWCELDRRFGAGGQDCDRCPLDEGPRGRSTLP